MTNPIVKSILRHAEAAIYLHNLKLAHSLVSRAERLAAADRTIPEHRVASIRTARLALAIAL